MNTDSPSPDAQAAGALPPHPAGPLSGQGAGECESPGTASRNVLRGLVGVVAAALGGCGLLIVQGPRGLLPVVLALGVFLVLWVVERLGVLRQANGAFCAFGVVAVFAVAAGFADFAYERYAVRRGRSPETDTRVAGVGTEGIEGRSPVPVEAAGRGEPRSAEAAAPVVQQAAGENPKLAAIQEARRRYPAIWEAGSAQNKAFVEATEQLRRSSPELLKEPDWVLRLAESLAREEGWDASPNGTAGLVPTGQPGGAAASPGSLPAAVPKEGGGPQRDR